ARTLFNDFFQPTDSPDATTKRRGRNASLHARRNECLIDRYYYYGKFFEQKLAYSYILKKLSNEFFLSEITVVEAMQDNYEQLARLRREPVTLKTLREKWPHLSW